MQSLLGQEQTMAIVLCLLLMLRVGQCTGDQSFVNSALGETVTLTCTYNSSRDVYTLLWIRIVAGNLPEVLGIAHSYNADNVNSVSGITSKKEPGRFILNITETKLTDTAFYYCVKMGRHNLTFLKGTFLRIKGPEPDVTAIIQNISSAPVRPGASVTLQCSVLSDSEKKTCPGDHSVYWFRAGSDTSHPNLLYTDGKTNDECDKTPEAHSPQRCVYNFTKSKVSSSDAGTYHCAVATCGEILFGSGTKLDIEVVSTSDSLKADIIVSLLCAALAISLIVIAFLVYAIRKKSCDSYNAAVDLQTTATSSGDRQSQQRDEDSLAYSTPNFSRRKAGKSGRRAASAKEETIYSDVRAFVMD